MRKMPKTNEKPGKTDTVEDLCEEILATIEPPREERERIQCLADELLGKVTEIAGEKDLEIDVRVEGSFAKDTWVRGEVDVDIFLLFPTTVGREDFEKLALEIAEDVLAPNRTRRRYAEHPYLEAEIEGILVNIVPAYKAQRGQWISSTDRTPFHTEYVKDNLEPKKRNEVRLLKKFMKETGTYGAEIRVGGFSGYLSEILIMHYGTFLDTIRSAAKWRNQPFIDIEGYYQEKKKVKELFNQPLIVIDPVDMQRNLASAVTMKKLGEFIAACREFLQHPHRGFFTPKEEVFSEKRLLQNLKERGTYCLFINVNELSIVPDVLWGQLYKSLKAICRVLDEEGFRVLRSTVWSEECGETIFIIEMENGRISETREQVGPFVWSEEANHFLEKHLNNSGTVYGPWIEGERWMVRVNRTHFNAIDSIREKIDRDLDSIGLGSRIQAAMKRKYRVMTGNEILPVYSRNKDFARHLTRFLKGSPSWLRR